MGTSTWGSNRGPDWGSVIVEEGRHKGLLRIQSSLVSALEVRPDEAQLTALQADIRAALTANETTPHGCRPEIGVEQLADFVKRAAALQIMVG